MKYNYVEKSLKMPYAKEVGYFTNNDKKIFAALGEDDEIYFDKKDEDSIEIQTLNISTSSFTALPRAVVKEGELTLGETTIMCSVLNDGRRIIKDTSLFKALKRSRKGETRIDGYPPILGSKTLVSILEELYPEQKEIIFPIEVAQFNGTTGLWYDANAIPLICDLYMEAEERNLIKPGQDHVLKQAKILLRSLAKVGITALIDEVTNYQDVRGKDELQLLLAKFITEELQPYSSQFPPEYFKQLFRLYNLPYDPTTSKRPRYFAQFNIKYVWEMLPPQVWEKLDQINPTIYNENTNRKDRKTRIYRNLTDEGIKWLQSHLQALLPIMTLSKNKDEFNNNFNKCFSKQLADREKMKQSYQLSISDVQSTP